MIKEPSPFILFDDHTQAQEHFMTEKLNFFKWAGFKLGKSA